ncbi:hypothetical protein EV126DRAFT_195242 [Verticillium dahliae]|nr:hypothetical protein EV126DRAFT_195242 [Verticillium dahliae]
MSGSALRVPDKPGSKYPNTQIPKYPNTQVLRGTRHLVHLSDQNHNRQSEVACINHLLFPASCINPRSRVLGTNTLSTNLQPTRALALSSRPRPLLERITNQQLSDGLVLPNAHRSQGITFSIARFGVDSAYPVKLFRGASSPS